MTFNSRHKNRDSNLSNARDLLLNNILNDLKSDPEVIGIYLSGSLAKENYDKYSDIDIHVVVKKDSRDTFINNKFERPKRWGEILFYEKVNPRRPVAVVHFKSFIKVDTWFHSLEEIKPTIWLSGSRVLYDPKNLIQPVLDESQNIKYQVTPDEVDQWRGKIFAYIHEVYRSVMRGELYYAISMLNSFRWQMARGWHMEMGIRVDSGSGVWSKVEGARSPLKQWQGDLLTSWHCQLEKVEVMKTLTRMTPEFLKLHHSLCEMTGLEKREEWCEDVINTVL